MILGYIINYVLNTALFIFVMFFIYMKFFYVKKRNEVADVRIPDKQDPIFIKQVNYDSCNIDSLKKISSDMVLCTKMIWIRWEIEKFESSRRMEYSDFPDFEDYFKNKTSLNYTKLDKWQESELEYIVDDQLEDDINRSCSNPRWLLYNLYIKKVINDSRPIFSDFENILTYTTTHSILETIEEKDQNISFDLFPVQRREGLWCLFLYNFSNFIEGISYIRDIYPNTRYFFFILFKGKIEKIYCSLTDVLYIGLKNKIFRSYGINELQESEKDKDIQSKGIKEYIEIWNHKPIDENDIFYEHSLECFLSKLK